MDTLGKNWSPVNTIKTALLSLRMLLEYPNANDPQDAQVAKMMMQDPEYFKVVAHDWAVLHAGATRKLPLPSEYKNRVKPEGTTSASVDPMRYEKHCFLDMGKRCGEDPANKGFFCDHFRYGGYNKTLVDRFVDMGFSVDAVVEAFVNLGIERRDGMDYEMEPAYIGDVTAFLFNEP